MYHTGFNSGKWLVGILPNGLVAFLSPVYPGSTTDKELVVASGLLEELNPGDNILADKGFLIDDILPEGKNIHYFKIWKSDL